jgi:hypothetical protein
VESRILSTEAEGSHDSDPFGKVISESLASTRGPVRATYASRTPSPSLLAVISVSVAVDSILDR